MIDHELLQRQMVVAEAKTWLGPPPTPFLHNHRIKGFAADCETFLCEVFHLSGIFTALKVPYIPAQWFQNGREELYLKYLSRYAKEYRVKGREWKQSSLGEPHPEVEKDEPQPGDIICIRNRWVHSHAAIVVSWPTVIHCHPPHVMESDVFSSALFRTRELKFFDPWGVR